MIAVDTSVLSEPLKSQPDAGVMAWLQRHRHELAVTAITVGELRHGVLRLRQGKRRATLMTSVSLLVEKLAGRHLSFDHLAAEEYAVLRAEREAVGLGVCIEDMMIAAICRARNVGIAARNTERFEDIGLTLINPWTDD